MRPLVFAIVTVGVAAGVGVGMAAPAGAATRPTAPTVSYTFSPAAVTVNAATTGSGTSVLTEFERNEEGYTDDPACPDGFNSDHPFGNPAQSAVTCTATDLTDSNDVGAYVVRNRQDFDGDYSIAEANGVLWVPSNDLGDYTPAPLTVTQNASARTATITGSVGPVSATLLDGGDSTLGEGAVTILDSSGAAVCSTQTYTEIPTSDGQGYSFTCVTSTLGYGTHTLSAVIADEGLATADDIDNAKDQAGIEEGEYILGTYSSSLPVGTVNFPAPIVPAGPIAGDVTPVWSFSIAGDLTNLHPGDTIVITGSGLPAGTTLDSILHSTPTDLGTVVAASDGTFTQTVVIPQDVEIGDHTIQVTATGPGLVPTTQQQPITVTTKPADSTGKTAPVAPKPTASHSNGEGGSADGTAIAPNILTRALTPFADIAVHPNKIVSALEIGLVLLLLAVLPAHLLNATIAEQSERFEKKFGKARMPGWLFRLGIWFRSAPVVGGIIVTLATAILFGFADPKFGFTLASLRLILAAGIALFLVGYVANALTGLIARVQWGIVAAVSTRPYGLILTVIGVVVSRILHFSPGFLIGLILGLTIQERSTARYAWRTIVLRSSIVLLMAIAAWIGYSTLTLGGNEGGTFGSALIVETLVAITTEGVVALLVELLPLRFLEGQRIYDQSRALWGFFYFVTLVVFVLAVVPWEGNWDALHGSLGGWIVVLVVFAALCVGVYVYFRRFAPPIEAEDADEEVPLGEAVSREQ